MDMEKRMSNSLKETIPVSSGSKTNRCFPRSPPDWSSEEKPEIDVITRLTATSWTTTTSSTTNNNYYYYYCNNNNNYCYINTTSSTTTTTTIYYCKNNNYCHINNNIHNSQH